MSEVVVSATRVRQIGIVGDQTAPKSRVTLTSEYLETQPPGQTRVPGPQPDPGRELHQHRSVRHLGRQPAHPRLRRFAHIGDVRRRAAQRLRQLRPVHQPDARSRARRSRRREPRHHRRRQPDGVGHRRHGRVPHQETHRRIRRRAGAVRRRVQLPARIPARRHRRVRPLGHQGVHRRLPTRTTTSSRARANSRRSSSTP